MLGHIISMLAFLAVATVCVLAFSDSSFVLYIQSIPSSTVWGWLGILVALLFIVRILRIVGDRLGWPQWLIHARR
jgi:hypothetical protein